MGNEGVNKLAAVLQTRMNKLADKPEILDFGLIQQDLSLLLNRFPCPIPQSDYLTCLPVRRGDRVLAGWVGDDVCVLGVVLPAEEAD